MENNKGMVLKFHEERLTAKTVPQVDMHKVMDTFKRSVDFFNSYGIAPKPTNEVKKPLAENNKWLLQYTDIWENSSFLTIFIQVFEFSAKNLHSLYFVGGSW